MCIDLKQLNLIYEIFFSIIYRKITKNYEILRPRRRSNFVPRPRPR